MQANDETTRRKTTIPESQSGDWSISKFTVSEADGSFDQLRASIHGSRRFTSPGTYTKLMRGKTLVMCDTPDEIDDHWKPIKEAVKRGGQILINGLGLGIVATAIIREAPNVEHLTVVECSEDVIKLVGIHLQQEFGDRISIVEADAFTWKPPKGVRYSVVWHDIWDNICADNLGDMHRLHRKYGRRADWQGSWCRWQCERQEKGWH